MRVRVLLAKLVLAAFTVAALFGIYGMISFSHAEYGNCPLSPIQHSLCATPLEHLDHWQVVFTAIFAELLVLLSLAAAFTIGAAITPELRTSSQQVKLYAPPRPTLLQELFSQGILHRKEPQIA